MVNSTQEMVPKFFDHIPNGKVKEGELWISMKYGIVSLSCPCGCGNATDLPIAPNKWSITFDGDKVSISPSILASYFKCKSHYHITNNQIVWA